MTQVVVERSAIAKFLDTVPQMIWEAKMNKDNQEFEAEQKQLDRDYAATQDSLNFKREVAKDIWNRKNTISDSLDALGLISESAATLKGEDSSGNVDSFVNRLQSSYKEGEDSLDSLISDITGEIEADRVKIASFNKGKRLFKSADFNDDGTLSRDEKQRITDQYYDKFPSWDIDAFTEGLYAGELDATLKTELDIKKEQAEDLRIRGKYLEGTLIRERDIGDIQVDITGLEKEQLQKEILINEEKYKIAQVETSMADYRLEQLKLDVEQSAWDFDLKKDAQLRSSLDENELIYTENASSAAMSLLQNIKLLSSDGSKVLPLFTHIMKNADGDPNLFASKFENLDTWFRGSKDYEDRFDQIEDMLGDAGSIRGDISGLLNAISIGWNAETGQLELPKPFLNAIVDIKTEVDQFLSTPLGEKADDIMFIYENATGESIHTSPKEFLNWLSLSPYSGDITEDNRLSFMRYIQFKNNGLTGKYMDNAANIMDSINEHRNLKTELNNRIKDANF
jgi:hypothetical protein